MSHVSRSDLLSTSRTSRLSSQSPSPTRNGLNMENWPTVDDSVVRSMRNTVSALMIKRGVAPQPDLTVSDRSYSQIGVSKGRGRITEVVETGKGRGNIPNVDNGRIVVGGLARSNGHYENIPNVDNDRIVVDGLAQSNSHDDNFQNCCCPPPEKYAVYVFNDSSDSSDLAACIFVPAPEQYRVQKETTTPANGASPALVSPSTNPATTPSTTTRCESPFGQSASYQRTKQHWELRKDNFDGARFIDTHCHLDILLKRDGYSFESFPQYRDRKASSWAMCYEGCIADFCYPELFMADDVSNIWPSIAQERDIHMAFGCHPHVVSDYTDEVEKFIIERMQSEKVVAVGEMGLDYSKNNNQNHDLQKRVFKRQLELAIKANKPILIHCREAEYDCFNIMKEMVPYDFPIHRHCFTGNVGTAYHWTNHFTKLKMGLTTGVYDPRPHQVELLREFPLDRLIIETDSPYFLPRVFRGYDRNLDWNHPGLGYLVAVKLAEERKMDIQEILQITRQNTKDVYGI